MTAHTAVGIVDDLDGSKGATSVAFALDGAGYEINLSPKNAKALRQAFAPFVAAGRQVEPSRAAGTRRTPSRGRHVTGDQRAQLAAEITRQYHQGCSVRELAEAHGRSYGFIHRVLTESGVALRGRGAASRSTAGKK